MARVDFHIHTNKSDGAGTVAQVLEAASRQPEIVAIGITDHNELAGALEAERLARKRKYHFEVIIGEEVSTSEGHIVGLFLTDKIERGLSPEETIRRIHRQGGVAIVPHPFPHYQGIGRQAVERLVRGSDSETHPDGIEVRNGFPPQLVFAAELHKLNHKIWNLAEVGGSDSHHPRSVACCWTEFDGNNLSDFRKALLARTTRSAGAGWTVLEMARASVRDAQRHLSRRFLSD
jgi:predicted metal-dependent phosphoesterase TrpH